MLNYFDPIHLPDADDVPLDRHVRPEHRQQRGRQHKQQPGARFNRKHAGLSFSLKMV